jgi:outer membrane protein assembly factor BamD
MWLLFILDKAFMRKFISLTLIMTLLVSLNACKGNKKADEVEVTRHSAEALYNKAKKYLDLQIWDNAIIAYKNLRNQYPFGRYAEQGTLELAYAYFKNHEMETAISTIDRFIKNYPAHEHLDYAHYLKGLVYFESDRGFFQRVHPDEAADRNQENIKQSFVAFKSFIEKFPNSEYAADAEQRMVFLRNQLAAFEVKVATYYLRRAAYVGAINRCKYVIETFQQTPAVPNALAIMAESYKQLEQNELASSTVKVLQDNYPNHPYLVNGEIDTKTKLFSFKDLWIFSKN